MINIAFVINGSTSDEKDDMFLSRLGGNPYSSILPPLLPVFVTATRDAAASVLILP